MALVSVRRTVGNIRELKRFQPAKGQEKSRFLKKNTKNPPPKINELVIPLLK